MKYKGGHLSYCSNIHSGESWDEIFNNLEKYTLTIKKQLTNEPFGIGLRLSNRAANELLSSNTLSIFKKWLNDHNCYIFTLNGFPYGNFHQNIVKENVHTPDWSSLARLNYTQRLITILAELLPQEIDGGISTSPISYRHWHQSDQEQAVIMNESCQNLITIVTQLIEIQQSTGNIIHIDIEPEPDGLLETTDDVIKFFNSNLIPYGVPVIMKKYGYHHEDAEKIIKSHIRICLDICHLAVGFEKPKETIEKYHENGLKIGKLQISSALSTGKLANKQLENIKNELSKFDEPTYLHQAIIKDKTGKTHHYRDLNQGLAALDSKASELRTHYHVPIFTNQYHHLISTQAEIIETLNIWSKLQFCNHLEVETYTWEILPKEYQIDIVATILRELNWVKEILK